MRTRWEWLLLPPALISLALLATTQIVFLRVSFFADRGLGQIGSDVTLANYVKVFTDPFYLNTLWLTVQVSAAVVTCSLLIGFPVAYILARLQSRLAPILIAAIVVTSFVTIVVKVLGLIIIFGADGPMNSLLRGLALIDRPLKLLGTIPGVVVGLLHYTLGFMVLVLLGVIQSIPQNLEDAAMIHGANRWRMYWRIVLPLSLPGLVGGALIVFNLSMGAFTSAALLGGGRVLTLPVLIQRTILLETKYAMAATVSAVLLVFVLLINLISVYLVSRLKAARLGVA